MHSSAAPLSAPVLCTSMYLGWQTSHFMCFTTVKNLQMEKERGKQEEPGGTSPRLVPATLYPLSRQHSTVTPWVGWALCPGKFFGFRSPDKSKTTRASSVRRNSPKASRGSWSEGRESQTHRLCPTEGGSPRLLPTPLRGTNTASWHKISLKTSQNPYHLHMFPLLK